MNKCIFCPDTALHFWRIKEYNELNKHVGEQIKLIIAGLVAVLVGTTCINAIKAQKTIMLHMSAAKNSSFCSFQSLFTSMFPHTETETHTDATTSTPRIANSHCTAMSPNIKVSVALQENRGPATVFSRFALKLLFCFFLLPTNQKRKEY